MSETCFKEMPLIGECETGRCLETLSHGNDSINDIVFKSCDGNTDLTTGDILKDKIAKDNLKREKILKNFNVFFKPPEVVECRIHHKDKNISYGYFSNGEDLAKSVMAYENRNEILAIYVTLNPVKSSLLAKCANRIQLFKKPETLTSDDQIEMRKYLLIDIDPCRPAGVCSTNKEHEEAFHKTLEIKDFLAALGWPEPVVGDSGNGAGLIYRIDLPGNDSTVEQVLKALGKKFTDKKTSVDESVFNPSRIRRLYGTTNRKGDDLRGIPGIEDRPWRVSDLISIPEKMEVVSKEQMESLIVLIEEEEKNKEGIIANGESKKDSAIEKGSLAKDSEKFEKNKLIVERVLKTMGERGIESKENEYKNGLCWDLDQCPMSNEHSDGSYLQILPNGAIKAGCQHNSCKNKWGWRELRAKYDSEEYSPIEGICGEEKTKLTKEIKQLSSGEADAQLQRLFEIDETFRNNYCTPAVKPNRSDIEFGLCAKMFEAGFDEKSVIRLMDASPQGKWHEEGYHYRNRTIRSAWEKVARAAREMLRTPVILGPDLSQNVDNCLMALYKYNNPPEIFQRAGSLCRIKTIDAKENRFTIENITPYALRIEMSKATVFKIKSAKKGKDEAFREVQPQLDLANCVLANSSWDFPSLNGLTNAPMIRPDGTILDCPGYDKSTGFYYIPDVNLDIPEIPEKLTKEDAIEAAKFILDEILIDFPFVDTASRQNAIAMFLSPIVRPMIAGCVPLALIDKPSPGTGASKLLELISIVATGRLMSVDTAPDDEDEWRKKITSLLRDGASLIYLDNIDADLKAPTLASALTSSFWRDRLLQQSKVVEYLQRACWYATGNHLTLKGDIPRRSFLSQMDAKLERPWERETKKFRHPDINMWVKENRGVILSKLLIMAAAWVQAGRLKGNGKIIGSFEDWVEVVGGILEFAGLNEFLGNLDKVYENLNAGNNEWSQFFRTWFEIHKDKAMKSSDVYVALQSNEFSDYAPTILSTKLSGIRSKDIQTIGIVLRRQVDVIFGDGLKLIQEEDKHAGGNVWKVVKISEN